MDVIWTDKIPNMVGNVYFDTQIRTRSPKRPFTKRCTFRSLLRPKTRIMFNRDASWRRSGGCNTSRSRAGRWNPRRARQLSGRSAQPSAQTSLAAHNNFIYASVSRIPGLIDWILNNRGWVDFFRKHGAEVTITNDIMNEIKAPRVLWETTLANICRGSGLSEKLERYPTCPGYIYGIRGFVGRCGQKHLKRRLQLRRNHRTCTNGRAASFVHLHSSFATDRGNGE